MSEGAAPIVDVLVVGGGAAGVAAAVAAARAGVSVRLIESNGTLGGFGTSAEVSTVCGLHLRTLDGPAQWSMGGFPREVGERLRARTGLDAVRYHEGLTFLPYAPPDLAAVLDAVVAEHAIALSLHTTLIGLARHGEVWRATTLAWDHQETIDARVIVDASGVAWAAACAGAEIQPDEERQAPAIVGTVAGLPTHDAFALRTWLLKECVRGLRDGTAPEGVGSLSVVPGSEHAGTARFKLGLPVRVVGDADEPTTLERAARRALSDAVAWLRTLPGMDALRLIGVAPQLGLRTGRRALGEVVVTGDHVVTAAGHPEGVARGAWPIEHWTTGRQPMLRMLPLGAACEIPAGALIAKGVPGLYLAGRVISANEEAIASLRVIGTCLGTGYAAGRLAAGAVRGEERAATVAALRAEQVEGGLG